MAGELGYVEPDMMRRWHRERSGQHALGELLSPSKRVHEAGHIGMEGAGRGNVESSVGTQRGELVDEQYGLHAAVPPGFDSSPGGGAWLASASRSLTNRSSSLLASCMLIRARGSNSSLGKLSGPHQTRWLTTSMTMGSPH